MLKATLRSAVLLGLMGAWAMPSFAEVQNVRVGGDITVRGFHRQNLDLNGGNNDTGLDSSNDFIMSTTGLNVGADLTENVSAFIRIANERNWDLIGSGGGSTGQSAGTFDISQAYITLKELFYSPLTLRIGTQPIVWGRGFVLGSNLIPSVAGVGDDRLTGISANEFTDFTAFDAIRATVDLSNVGGMNLPLNFDYVYIKSDENNPGAADDTNIQGFNLGAHFDEMKAETELYYLNKRDKLGRKPGSVSTLGVRGSAKPVQGAYFYGELAYQFGRNAVDADGLGKPGTHHQAWAFDLGGEYTLDVALTPKIGAEWIFWSGDDNDGASTGWDPIARGYFTTALREFQTGTNVGFYPTAQPNDTGAFTNQHQFSLYGSLKPLEDLLVAPRLSFFFLDDGAIPSAGSKRRSYAGMEWDTQVTYNYTEDVQFGVLYGVFAPGNVYRSPNDDVAQEIVTTVGVKF